MILKLKKKNLTKTILDKSNEMKKEYGTLLFLSLFHEKIKMIDWIIREFLWNVVFDF